MNPFRLEQCLKTAESQRDGTRDNDNSAMILADCLNRQPTLMIFSTYKIRSSSDTLSKVNWKHGMNREGVISAKILPM